MREECMYSKKEMIEVRLKEAKQSIDLIISVNNDPRDKFERMNKNNAENAMYWLEQIEQLLKGEK